MNDKMHQYKDKEDSKRDSRLPGKTLFILGRMVFHGFLDSWGNLHTNEECVTFTQGRMVGIALQFNGPNGVE